MEQAEGEALSRGAFSVKLFGCDAPLHTPLMAAVAEDLSGMLREYRFCEPAVPIMEHIGQDYLTAAEIPSFVINELTLPVYWEKCYKALRKAGVSKFVEVGAGDSLKKYNRWIEIETRGREAR